LTVAERFRWKENSNGNNIDNCNFRDMLKVLKIFGGVWSLKPP